MVWNDGKVKRGPRGQVHRRLGATAAQDARQVQVLRGILSRRLDMLTSCKHHLGMVLEILAHPDYLRVLCALRKADGLRFNQIQKSLRLNPAQVDRALKALTKGLWVIPQTVPTEAGRIPVEYHLGKRGALFLELFDDFKAKVARRRADLGAAEVAELQRICA